MIPEYVNRATVTVRIKEDKFEDFKQTILNSVHYYFLQTHRQSLEDIKLMQMVCPQEADFLLRKIKEKYTPVEFYDERKIECKCTVHADPTKPIDKLLMVLSDEYATYYVKEYFEDNMTEELSKVFEEETVSVLETYFKTVFDMFRKRQQQDKLNEELEQTLDSVKPNDLREKIANLVKSIQEKTV